jgi:hypothetical protein
LINPDQANRILGHVPNSGVAPNPDQPEHDSLTKLWWILEVFPHSYYDSVAKKKKWRIPLGASRTITPGSVIHESVWTKLATDPTYRPKNLPPDWNTNPVWKATAEPNDSSKLFLAET